MELDRDDFVIAFDPSKATIDDLLNLCENAGFPATVVEEDETAKRAAVSETVETPAPDFFVAALAIAKEERKPVVLDFSAEWCAPCQVMIREVFPDPRVAELLKRFIFLTIDTDEFPDLAQKFGVIGIPDIRLLTPDGKEIRQILGAQDAEDFSRELADVLEELGTQTDESKD